MKKGISLIVLTITIIVMVILTGVIIITSDSTVVNVEKYKLQMDIAQLETLMNTYKIRKNGNIAFEVIEFNTTRLNAQEMQQFAGEIVQNNEVQLYVIDLAEIDAEQVNFGNLEHGVADRYLYSINTGKVYYERGLIVGDITYYYVANGEG